MSDSKSSGAPQNTIGVVLETGAVVLDVGDIGRQADFWGALIGENPGPLRSEGGWLTVGSLGPGTFLVLQKVPETKIVKNRLHLDFGVADVDQAVREIVALGGVGSVSPVAVEGSRWPTRRGTSSASARSAEPKREDGLPRFLRFPTMAQPRRAPVFRRTRY